MRWAVLALFLGAVAVVHLRGRVRLPFMRQLVNHSALLAPINVFLYALSAVPPRRPFIDVAGFPELRLLQEHWQTIRDEVLALQRAAEMRSAEMNDAGFNSFFKYGWRRFYLKWYDDQPPSARALCPRTVELLSRLGSVKAALFAELPPGGRLNSHRDPYAGSLRYHLGLATPNDDGCWIEVDGERYSWRDGEAVMFDETFVHQARNETATSRLILFCDIERPLRYRWAAALNRWFGRHVMTAASSPNREGDRTGFINRIFVLAWHAGQARRRFKRWSPAAYHTVRVLLVVALLAWLVFG